MSFYVKDNKEIIITPEKIILRGITTQARLNNGITYVVMPQ